MDNAEEFVRACRRAQIPLVLFGHRHRQYYRFGNLSQSDDPSGRIHFLCCPGTLVNHAEKPGFCTLDVSGPSKAEVKLYEKHKDTSQFQLTARSDLSF